MKNMKRIKAKMIKNTVKILGNVSLIIGEAAVDRACIGFTYEPKVPEILLKK